MISVQDVIRKAAKQLEEIAENPQREARLLLAYALNTSYEEIFFPKNPFLTPEEETIFTAFLQRRLAQEPLSKIRGYREFWGLTFRVTKDTLDPRPDSETLIETVLKHYPDKTQALHILDLGTGTGCLLLSLLYEYPYASGVGIDRSERAALTAQGNAIRLNLKNRSSFMVGDWGEPLNRSFDIIVSNPPYISQSTCLPLEVVGYDPATALFAGEDGLDAYRALARQIPRLVTPHSQIFLEMGGGQTEAIKDIFSFAIPLHTAPDLGGVERCLVLRIPTVSIENM